MKSTHAIDGEFQSGTEDISTHSSHSRRTSPDAPDQDFSPISSSITTLSIAFVFERRRRRSAAFSKLWGIRTPIRRPQAQAIFHSDRGSQYASEDYRNVLKLQGRMPSMSRKAICDGCVRVSNRTLPVWFRHEIVPPAQVNPT